MSGNDKVNRRQFLEKTSLLTAAVAAVGAARQVVVVADRGRTILNSLVEITQRS